MVQKDFSACKMEGGGQRLWIHIAHDRVYPFAYSFGKISGGNIGKEMEGNAMLCQNGR